MSEKTKDGEPVFLKEQLVDSAAFRDKRDVLMAILEDGKSYSKQQTEDLLAKFLKGKVK